MVDPPSTNKAIDTGQNAYRNSISTQNNVEQQQQRSNLVENVMRNQQNGQQASQSQHNAATVEGMSVVNDQRMNQERSTYRGKREKEIRGLSIEMEFQGEVNEEECFEAIIKVTLELVKQWKKGQAIDGVVTSDGEILESGYDNIRKWARAPKVVGNKKRTKVETMLEVLSPMTAYELYHAEKQYCDQNKIRIGSKNTIMEYTKKIGFLVGTYVRVASPRYYIDELNKILKTSAKVIDIKKGFTWEKGLKTKALIVYAIEREAKVIDEILIENVDNMRYRYVSYRNSPSQEKLAAMHHNEMANGKAKYETLYNINLKDEVRYDDEQSVTLEQALMDEKSNGHNLFLAAEQGSGKFENDVTVIINPRVKVEAWKWLSEEYGKWEVYQDREMMTSVDPDKCKGSWKYNESLKQFLKPTLQNVNFKKNKYGKRIKTYAQVLGITVEKNDAKNEEKKNKMMNEQKAKEVETKSDETLLTVIKGMQEQINALQKIIQVLCDTVVKDDDVKNTVLEKMNQINKKAEKVDESKVNEKKRDERDDTDQIQNTMNNGKRKEVEKRQDILKITTHPNAAQDESGNINNVIRSWYQSTKIDDQKIADDHKVKKHRQQ